eukprot:evm.model.scf_852EXC.4 EVM.evm.TU.scf_852EXC.4   scf_852EXC:27281-29072(-)
MFPGGPCLSCGVAQSNLWHRGPGSKSRDLCDKCRKARNGLKGDEPEGGVGSRGQRRARETTLGEANMREYPGMAMLFQAAMVEEPRLMAALMGQQDVKQEEDQGEVEMAEEELAPLEGLIRASASSGAVLKDERTWVAPRTRESKKRHVNWDEPLVEYDDQPAPKKGRTAKRGTKRGRDVPSSKLGAPDGEPTSKKGKTAAEGAGTSGVGQSAAVPQASEAAQEVPKKRRWTKPKAKKRLVL